MKKILLNGNQYLEAYLMIIKVIQVALKILILRLHSRKVFKFLTHEKYIFFILPESPLE